MTQDFFLGQLRLIAVAVIAYFSGTGKLSTADGTLIGAVGAPILLLFGPWLWSIYHNVNMKLVPKDSVAVKTDADTHDYAMSTKGTGNAAQVIGQVVGALLFAVILSTFVQASAFAQTPAPKPNPARVLMFPDGPAQTVIGKFAASIAAWVDGDIEAAETLATSTDLKDDIGATCWKSFAAIGQVVKAHPLPLTLKLASDIQAARLVLMGAKRVCNEPACTQVWQDMQNQVAAFTPIAPFTLTSICAKVL